MKDEFSCGYEAFVFEDTLLQAHSSYFMYILYSHFTHLISKQGHADEWHMGRRQGFGGAMQITGGHQ